MPTPDEILMTEPKWKPEDLGEPLPDSPHANSVCLPQWCDVIDYEEKSMRVIERLQAGYPRFVVPQEKIEKAGGSVVVVPGKTPVEEKKAAAKGA